MNLLNLYIFRQVWKNMISKFASSSIYIVIAKNNCPALCG